MTHLEYDNMLHPKVLLYEIHALRSFMILVSVVVIAIQPIHDVTLKVFQQIHLALEVFRILRNRVVLAHIHRPLSSRGDIVKVADTTREYTDDKCERKTLTSYPPIV